MTEQIRNHRISEIRPLLSPDQVAADLPISAAQESVVRTGRDDVAAILNGNDDRLLVIVGPCSVHDPVAALEYAKRLRLVADRLRDQLCVVMRVYFEKPRTTLGWKGLINDPGLDETYRVNDGLRVARRLLLDVLSVGLPTGCEFLDPLSPQYIADAVSWGAIGARTSQSQIHRQVASGLSMPIGFKNSTEGDIQGAIDAVGAAARPHVFPGIAGDGRAALFATSGNPDCHVVLRGGASGANYSEASVARALELLDRAHQIRRVVIDASHDNSGKDHQRQRVVVADIATRLALGAPELVGVMLESLAGRQNLVTGQSADLVYGQSITDSCMGWEETAVVLDQLAEAVIAGRRRTSR